MKKNIVGVAGEYFVAAELSQKGIIATLTLKNTPRVDVLATNLETGATANIQVKTMSVENTAGWRLSEKDAEISKIKNFYYVFVNLNGSGVIPEYYIIPHRNLSRMLRTDHQAWLNKKPGRKDTTMRVFDPYRRTSSKAFGEQFKNNWGVLKLW